MQLSMLTSLLSQQTGAKPNPAMTAASASQTSSPKMTAAAASGTGSSGSGAASAASNTGITANDFLSLLVTEMKNQDPTNQTDPMSYITQLVGVNSLEQLVQINQDLTPTTPTTTTPPATGALASTPMAAAGKATTLPTTAASSTTAFLPLGSQSKVSDAAAQAVSQAMGRSVPMASQASGAQLPPSHLAMQPEELRAIQMSIPGATMTGLSSTPIANVPTPSTGASGGSLP
ncbi:MAG TPA: flagellar hook capping FlgD N-terminal domain-containing protein [Acidobacteriaceae bacterium]|nr:flagellar hook capping FlgD N-terminal domain-containing protein [Acidobacteriaceae bacterium]